MTTETKTDDMPPLEPATVVRLRELVNEIIDINRAVERLSNHEDPESTLCAIPELRNAVDERLSRTLNLLHGHNEQGDSKA